MFFLHLIIKLSKLWRCASQVKGSGQKFQFPNPRDQLSHQIVKLWNLIEIVKFGQNCEIVSTSMSDTVSTSMSATMSKTMSATAMSSRRLVRAQRRWQNEILKVFPTYLRTDGPGLVLEVLVHLKITFVSVYLVTPNKHIRI